MYCKYLIILAILISNYNLKAIINSDSLYSIINSKKGIEKAKGLLELSNSIISENSKLSEKYSKIALNIANKNNDFAIKAEALKSLGKVFYFRSKYDTSLVYFKKAQVEFQNLNNIEGVASCVNNIGMIYKIWGKYSEALENFNKSIDIYKKSGNKKGIASTLQNIGIIYLNWSNYEKAIENYQNALKIKEELNDEPGIANSLNNIGEVYVMWSNFGKALENYNKSLEIRLKIDDKPGISVSYHNIGEVYKRIGDNIQAIDYYKKAIKIQKLLNDKSGLASSLNNIGEVYKNRKEYESALNYFNESLNLNEEISLKKGITVNLNNIGSTYKEQKKYDLALEFYNRSLEIANEIYLKDRVMTIFKDFADIYSDLGDFEKAYNYYKKSIILKDSIYNYIQFVEITTKYETEKLNREKKIELDKKQQEIEQQRVYTTFFIAGFLIVIIFIILLFKQFSQKKKANILLAIQKKEITDSIIYASRIQSAVLPPLSHINEILQEYFIVNLPRDIVSGDFYWINRRNNITYIAAADCTGHGVPGAFMSMLGITFLNDIVNNRNFAEPGLILDELKNDVIKSLHQTGIHYEKNTTSSLNVKDGMDISLIAIKLQDSSPKLKVPSEEEGEKVREGESEQYSVNSNQSPKAQEPNFKNQIPNSKNQIPNSKSQESNSKLQEEESEKVSGGESENQHIVSSSHLPIVPLSQTPSSKSQIPNSKLQENDEHFDKLSASQLNIRTIEHSNHEQQTTNIKHQTSNFFNAQWAGANNPLWIVRSNSDFQNFKNLENLEEPDLENLEEHINRRFVLQEVKPDKMPIGFSDYSEKFKTNNIELNKGDIIYLFTDGFADQFGGKKGKKYKYNKFRQFLVSISASSLNKQENLLLEEINNWKNNYEQVDDILIIGAKI